MSLVYTIPLSGSKKGRNFYDFEINNDFFEQFEKSDVKEGTLYASIEADRRSSHIDLAVRIKGVVRLLCDRCLGEFEYPVECMNRLLVKYGKTHDESNPDIITIPVDEHELDMKQYFYEYILLALPIQKVHPNDKEGRSTCDPDMLKKLHEHIINEENASDPRWDELKKLIKNN